MKEGSKVPRRGNVPKREVLPDPIYNSVLVTKLVNSTELYRGSGRISRLGTFPLLGTLLPSFTV